MVLAAWALASLALAGTSALGAAADSGHRFTIHNNSPSEIIEWRIAATGTRAWGYNLIAGAPVAPGEVRTIRFGQPGDPCVVDVLVVPRAGEASVAARQNDCDPHFSGAANFAAPKPATPPAATPIPTPAPKGAP